MVTELKIKISTTADIKAVQDAINTIDGVEKVSKTASKEIDNTSSSFDRMASSVRNLVASYIGYSAISSVVKSGVELTSQFEQMKIGIASLIAVNSQNVTSMGQHIDASQKFALAQKDSAEAIQLLRKANLETPATLAQLTQGFQSALGPAMALGFSVKETVKYSTLMTQAAAAMGVPMDQLSQEMASILNGNIDMNSVVAKNIGLTNEQVKAHIKQGDVYDFLIGKLSDFGAAGKEMENSWSGITSELEDSWNNFKMSTVHDSGIFDAAKSGATELNKLLLNQNGELDSLTTSLTRHTEELVGVYAAFKVGGWITSGLTAVSGSLLAIKTAEEAALVGSVALEASMMRLAKFASANPIFVTVTFAAVLTESFTQVRDWLEGDKINAKGSKVLQAAIAKAKDESSIEGQARSIGANYNQLSEQLNTQLAQRAKLVSASVDTKHIDDAIAKTKQALKDSQNVAKDFYNLTGSVDGLVAKPKVKSDADIKAEEEAAKKAAAAAENLKQAYLSINKDIAGFTGTEHDKAIANINDQAERYRKAKVDEVTIGELTSASMIALSQKENDEKNNLLIGHYETIGDEDAAYYLKLSMEIDAMVKKGVASYAEINAYREDSDRKHLEKKAQAEFLADEQAKEAIKTYNAGLLTANIDYYTAIGDTSSAYYLQEEQKMKKLAETGWYTNEQMISIKTKDNEQFRKAQWEKDNKFWVDLFGNINRAMDDQFFNAMSGKFTSFGSWLKDFWGAITQSLERGLSKSLADSILGTGNSTGGIMNWFKSYGGLSGAMGSTGTLLGTSVSASEMDRISSMAGSKIDSNGIVTTEGGSIFDGGKLTQSGTDIASLLNTASTLKTAYTAITGGLSSSIADTFASGAAYSYNGLTALGMSSETAGSIAGGIGNFGAGLSSPLAGFGSGGAAGWGSLAGGAALGAAGGYVLGSIGDKIFGTDTKAGAYGAAGGAIGAAIGSVVPGIGTLIGGIAGSVLGSIVGGMFGGGAHAIGSGLYVQGRTGDASNILNFTTMHKSGGWFSGSSEWNEYAGLSTQQITQIKGTFDAYNYLLSQFGKSGKVYIDAGIYTAQVFNDTLAKSFMSGFTGQGVSDTIFSYWTDYAKSINKTVAEALTSSVSGYIGTTRSFTEWKLGSGTTDQLKFTANYLTKDLAALENQIGVSGITVENYLSKYDEAMKSSFTPETINSWKSLGDALMKATDANTKYTDSIKALSTYTRPSDMMLARTGDATSITGQSNGTVNAAMFDVLQKMWKELQNQTTIAQLNRGKA